MQSNKKCKSRNPIRSNALVTGVSSTQRSRTTFRVKSTSSNGDYRHVTIVSDGGKETGIKLHKSALVGPEDRLHFDPANSTRIYVVSTEDAGARSARRSVELSCRSTANRERWHPRRRHSRWYY